MGPESILADQLKFQSFKGKITEAPYVYMCFGFVFLLFFLFFGFFFFFFRPNTCGLRDLRSYSPIRDGTHALGSESVKS